MRMRQYMLRQANKTNPSMMICWLDKKVKEGWLITLENSDNPKIWWLVTKVYDMELDKSEIKDSHDSKNWYRKDHHTKLTGFDL